MIEYKLKISDNKLIDFNKLIDDFLLERQLNNEREINPNVFHPSSLGGCSRAYYFELTENQDDYEYNSNTLRIFYIGIVVHNYINKLLEYYNAKGVLKLIGNEVKVFKGFENSLLNEHKGFSIAGSIDNIIEIDGTKFVIEIKSTSRYLDYMKEPVYNHIVQANCYMKLSEVENGCILYVNKKDLTVKAFFIKLDESLFKQTLNKIENIHYCIRKKQLPDTNDSTSYQCMNCEFKAKCKD